MIKIYHFAIDIWKLPSGPFNIATFQPAFSAVRTTLSLAVAESTSTCTVPPERELNSWRVSNAGCGHESPRASIFFVLSIPKTFSESARSFRCYRERARIPPLTRNGSLFSHEYAKAEANQQTDNHGCRAVGTWTGSGTCQIEIVSKAGADDHANDKDGGIAVSLTGQNHLAARAAARKRKRQAGQSHSYKIP